MTRSSPLARRISAAVLVASGVLVAPHGARAQGCSWVEPTRSAQSSTIPGQGQIWYLGGPSIRCTDGVRIQADSAVVYPQQNMTHLMGNVRFRDASKELTSDEARYFSRAGRLQANGNTVLRDTLQGSVIRNGDVVMLRRIEGRDADQITVTTGSDQVRPVARLTMESAPSEPASPGPDSTVAAGDPPPPDRPAPADTVRTPYVVEGDRLFLQGDEYFLASGSVVIERDSLRSYADTAEYDQIAERMILKGTARVEGETYVLVGRIINLALPGGEMRSVRAVREAVLTGEDLRLEAPLVQLFLKGGGMERLVATPLPGDPTVSPATAADSADLARPVAEAENFQLTADSVEVLAPGEVLDRIFASGSARGVSTARDSLNVESMPEIARTDWLEGDTIIATFSKVEDDPFLPPDTLADEYRLRQLVARGSARSLYRMLPSDSTSRPGVDAPAVHYVTGAGIVIVLLDGEVQRMEVDGPTRGWHLEPDRPVPGRDSVPVPDTAAAPPDTGSVRTGWADPAVAPGVAGSGDQSRSHRVGWAGKTVGLPAAVPGQRGRGRGSRR